MSIATVTIAETATDAETVQHVLRSTLALDVTETPAGYAYPYVCAFTGNYAPTIGRLYSWSMVGASGRVTYIIVGDVERMTAARRRAIVRHVLTVHGLASASRVDAAHDDAIRATFGGFRYDDVSVTGSATRAADGTDVRRDVTLQHDMGSNTVDVADVRVLDVQGNNVTDVTEHAAWRVG